MQQQAGSLTVGTQQLPGARRRLDIFVLMDALGWKFLEGREFLSDILPVRQPLRTVLGFSSGAIPSILTGCPPAVTGHWNLFYFDPQNSPFRWLRPLRYLPHALTDHRVSRKLLKEMGRHMLGMGPNFECCVTPRLMPWFNFIERRDIYAPSGISGAKSIFDLLREQHVAHRVYTYHQWNDAEILRRALADVQHSEAGFFFIYLCELDSLLHEQWKNPAPLQEKLEWYEQRLREIFQAARRIDPDASFTITSDHGMAPVRGHYDLVKDVEALGLVMPDDYLAVYDSTMARFWFFSERGRQAITQLLGRCSCGRILEDGELQELGILFPDRRYGEVIFLLHPGMMLAHSDFNGAGWMPTGMHGYHPDDPYSDAVFLSNQKPPAPVRTIADVYGCMQRALMQQAAMLKS